MVIVGISINTASKALVKAGEGTAFQVASDLAATTELFLEEDLKFANEMALSPLVEDVVNQVAENGMDAAMDAVEKLDRHFGKVHGKIGADYELFILSNSEGMTICDSANGALRKKKISIADRDYFKAGKFGGVFGAVLKLDALSKKLTAVKIGETGYPFLINKEGIIIAHPKKEFIA